MTKAKWNATFRSSDGRIRLTTLLGVSGLVAALALLLMLPAGAGAGDESAAGVQPTQVSYGGGSGACEVFSDAPYELHINNPMTGTYTGPDGTQVALTVYQSDELFRYEFLDAGFAAYDVIVNGGSQNTWYENDAPLTEDEDLHAPSKGNSSNLYKLSHINICYDEATSITGLVFDDIDFDGAFNAGDAPEEGVEITAFDGADSYVQTSDSNGNYQFDLPPGEYTVCQELREDRVQTLPTSGVDCSVLGDYEAWGYDVDLTSGSSSGNDFGTAEEVCGQILTDSFTVFVDVYIEVFLEGNLESDCNNKVGSISEVEGELHFPLVGSGEAAAIAIITKEFSDPSEFEPLEYSQDLELDPFEDLPDCALRPKTGDDGDQFDPYLQDDTMYPSLSGVTDPLSGDPSVSCLVFVSENVEGFQVSVALIQDDPRYK